MAQNAMPSGFNLILKTTEGPKFPTDLYFRNITLEVVEQRMMRSREHSE